MALTKCPECGGQVSTSATTCIHCGCKMKICPECNNAVKGDLEVCTSCGYKFTKEKQVETKVVEQPKGDNMLTIGQKYFRTIGGLVVCDVFGAIFVALGMCLAIFSVIPLASTNNSFELLSNKSTFDNCLVAGAIFLILGVAWRKVSFFICPKIRNSWLVRDKVDLINGLRLYLSTPTIPPTRVEKNKMKLLLQGRAQSEFSKNKATISFIFGLIFEITIEILLIVLIAKMGDGLFLVKLSGSRNIDVFSMIDIPILIVMLVIMVANIVVSACINSSINKDLHVWVNKNLPEHYTNYMTIFK